MFQKVYTLRDKPGCDARNSSFCLTNRDFSYNFFSCGRIIKDNNNN